MSWQTATGTPGHSLFSRSTLTSNGCGCQEMALFIAGVVPLVYLTGKAVFRPSSTIATADPTGAAFLVPLFTEVVEAQRPDGRGLRL